MAEGFTAARLVEFHTRHKLLLLSHSEVHYRAAGRLVADAGRREPGNLAGEYLRTFMEGMRRQATRRRHANVLQHLAGYLKRRIDSGDRQALAALIDEYRTGAVPLVVPIRFLRHHFRHASGPLRPDAALPRALPGRPWAPKPPLTPPRTGLALPRRKGVRHTSARFGGRAASSRTSHRRRTLQCPVRFPEFESWI